MQSEAPHQSTTNATVMAPHPVTPDTMNDCKSYTPTSTLQLNTPCSAPAVLIHPNRTPPAATHKRSLFTPFSSNQHSSHGAADHLWNRILQYIMNELCIHSDPSSDATTDSSLNPHITTILKHLTLPYYFEKLMFYATLLCADQFCNVFIVLPIRLVLMPLIVPYNKCKVTPRHQHDMIKSIIIASSLLLLYTVHMSRIYHYIRGQNTLKLYVIYNMLQITDKLLCSAGEDIIYNTLHTNNIAYKSMYLFIAILYNFIHALIIYLCIITLNVSINSDDNSLFVLLISNNFTELKSVVFKRCDSSNLMQISLSDATERLQLILFLCCIIIQNITNIQQTTNPNPVLPYSEQSIDPSIYMYDWLYRASISSLAVYLCELIIDWIKHSYINKFNSIDVNIYQRITTVLSNDYIQSCQFRSQNDTEYMTQLSRRFGFSYYPMMVVCLRVLLPIIAKHMNYSFHTAILITSCIGMLVVVKLCVTYTLTLCTVYKLTDNITLLQACSTTNQLLSESTVAQHSMYDSILNQVNIIDYDPKLSIQLCDVERYKMIKSIPA